MEHSFKRGAFQQDCGAWVLRRGISANCLRYNTRVFPELRQDGEGTLKVRDAVWRLTRPDRVCGRRDAVDATPPRTRPHARRN